MSARVGLVAVRELGVEAFVGAFPTLATAGPATTDGWTWASFSLFAVADLVGPKADAGLAGLGRPALQAWTEDGALWYLAIHAPGRETFRLVHWFRYNHVAGGREKAKKGITLRRYLDEYESGLLEDYRHTGPLPKGALPAAMARYLVTRATALSDCLSECGVNHDREAVRAAITGESVTREEWSWDVGNLPRLLYAIGLGGAFPDWKEEIELARRADEEARAAAAAEKEAPPEDLVAPILEHLDAAEPAPVDGGPVAASVATLWLLPWACHSDVELALMVRPSRPVKVRWPRLQWLSVVERDGEWRIGHPWCSVWQRARLLEKLQARLDGLPKGSVVELVSAAVPDPDDEDAPVTAGDMRFRMVLDSGSWQVTHAYPAAGRADLVAALEIFDWVKGRGPFVARDEAEAAAVLELGRKGDLFGNAQKDQPVVAGRDITSRSRPMRHHLAMAVFRHRFAAGPWDTIASQQADEAFAGDLDRMIADIGAKFSRALAAPREEELVHQGERSAFRRADHAALRGGPGLFELFRSLYPARDLGTSLDLPAAVRLVDESMAKCGLTPLGDMVCEAFGEVVIRGYASESGDAFGLVYAGTLGQFAYEFNTQFIDGSSLTTSLNPGSHHAEIGSYHAHFPGASVEDLFAQHRTAVAKRTRGKVRPDVHPPDLAALAQKIDEFLVRTAA